MSYVESFVQFLQASISPIVLISGVGLILLSLTNRLGRTIDRVRIIVGQLESDTVKNEEKKRVQLKILYRRGQILRSSIVSISFSILSSSLIIPVILMMRLLDFDLRAVGIILFLLSVTGIIISAIFLLIDVSLNLHALNHEVEGHLK